jgi:serine/threonine protein phosphatase PrpC/serine/threonine protein kinase
MIDGMRVVLLLHFLLFVAGADDDTVIPLADIIRQHRRNIVQLLRNLQRRNIDGTFPTTHQHWKKHCRRIGKEVQESGVEVRRDAVVDVYSPNKGMTLQVYNVDNCETNENHPQDDNLITTYELLDPLILELGTVPKHESDYAYRSVLVWRDPDDELQKEETSTATSDIEVKPHSQVALKITPSTWWQWWFVFMGSGRPPSSTRYEAMGEHGFAGGSHGEVWRGRRRCANDQDCDDQKPLILKRLKVEHGIDLLEAGLREIYFGNVIGQVNRVRSHFTIFVDHFFRQVPGKSTLELWIVFEDAGSSLRSYLYKPISSEGGFVVFQHSPFWRKLRLSSTNRTIPTESDEGSVTSVSVGNQFPQERRPHKTLDPRAGRTIMREILRQILESAARLADNGIVHRDIKPSNVMCKTDIDLGKILGSDNFEADVSKIDCVLGDFSSAWDRFSDQNLYSKGPSKDEQTQEYSPPETLIGPSWIPFNSDKPGSYDSWSIGVLALELLLGTPNVFSVDQRTTVLLTNRMTKHGASQEDIKRALYLAALSQFCIFAPEVSSEGDSSKWPMRDGDPLHRTAMVRQSCTIKDFHQALRARDPLGIGFDSSADLLLHLIWKLLAWDPLERYTPSEALLHPFFTILDLKEHSLIPTDKNALESLMLDPRMDIQGSETVDRFTCPKCGRNFTDWQSCHSHANSRKHAKFCTYDQSKLPSCLNAHALLPEHPFSGYCDIQGRRRTIEDFHAVQLHPDHHFYGVFDGHNGNLAAKYVASVFYGMLQSRFANISAESKYVSSWKEDTATKMNGIFQEIHQKFLEAVSFAPVGVMDQSGTTATIIYMNDHVVLIASVGDSRAIMSSKGENGILSFVQLTDNHVASNPVERELVVQRGGTVTKSPNGVCRVEGALIITRSIGDSKLSKYLSREPSVVAMTRDEMNRSCGLERCFVVLASDGLWDVMNNQEVVDMVNEVLEAYSLSEGISWEEGGAFQEAAERLTREAYVRGSTDNIGVSVSGTIVASSAHNTDSVKN